MIVCINDIEYKCRHTPMTLYTEEDIKQTWG